MKDLHRLTGNDAAARYHELVANQYLSPLHDGNDRRDYLTRTLQTCEKVSFIFRGVSNIAERMLRRYYGMLYSEAFMGRRTFSLTGRGRKSQV